MPFKELEARGLPGRIVFADSDADLRQKVRPALELSDLGKKIVVATCGNGQELLSRLRELQPSLILLDLHLPEMSGLDTLDILRDREDGKEIPVIFLTSKQKVVMEDSYKNLGVIGVIHKPFDVTDLLPKIFKIWQDEFGVFEGEIDGRVLSELMENPDADTFSAAEDPAAKTSD